MILYILYYSNMSIPQPIADAVRSAFTVWLQPTENRNRTRFEGEA